MEHRDVPDIRFRLARYLAILYYPVLVPDLAKMLNGTRYHNWIFTYLRATVVDTTLFTSTGNILYF